MPGDNARQQAIDRLQSKRGLTQSAVSFAAIAVLLVVIWLIAGRGFFWPIFPIADLLIAFRVPGLERLRPEADHRGRHPALRPWVPGTQRNAT